MGDPSKLFEIFKTKSDNDALNELNKILREETDLSHWGLVGYKPSTQTPGFAGFGATAAVNDNDHKESSLFQYALETRCYQCAAMLLEKVGIAILSKSNEKKENGFHAVARANHDEFRQWFFNQSCVAHLPQLSEEVIKALNQITLADQHVLSLCYGNAQAKPADFQAWLKFGANPALPGSKQGSILHLCCEKEDAQTAKIILDLYPELMFSYNDKRQYPIHIAASKENSHCLVLLIDKGTPLTIPDKNLNRPLHHAIAKASVSGILSILKRVSMVDINGEQIAYANVPNGSQERPLHLLILHNKIYKKEAFDQALDILLAYGADLSALNGYKQIPLQAANELLKDNKIAFEDYELIWKKTLLKQPLHLFSRNILYARIESTYTHQQADFLRESLEPLFKTPACDPIAQLTNDFCWVIEQLARKRYVQTHPSHLQAFLNMFSQLQQDYFSMQKQYNSPLPLLVTEWKIPGAQPHIDHSASSMQLADMNSPVPRQEM